MNEEPMLFKIIAGGCIAGGFHLSLGFTLNQENNLLAEHFPNLPVTPASLTLGFLVSCISSHLALDDYRLSFSDVRFTHPIIPDLAYTCSVNFLPCMRVARFFMRGLGGKTRVRGQLELKEYCKM